MDLQVLNDEVTISLEARVRRQRLARRDQAILVDAQLRRLMPLGQTRSLAAGLGRGPSPCLRIALTFHPAGLERRLRLLALEHRNLIAQLLDGFRLPVGFLSQPFDQRHQLLDHRGAFRVGDVG